MSQEQKEFKSSAPVKVCRYFPKGCCKYQSACRFLHCQETLDQMHTDRSPAPSVEQTEKAIAVTCVKIQWDGSISKRKLEESLCFNYKKKFLIRDPFHEVVFCKKIVESMKSKSSHRKETLEYYDQLMERIDLSNISKKEMAYEFIKVSKAAMEKYIQEKYSMSCGQYYETWTSMVKSMDSTSFTKESPGYRAWIEVKKKADDHKYPKFIRFHLPQHLLPRDDVFIAAYAIGEGIHASFKQDFPKIYMSGN
jgi:hypothetical protein